MKKTLQTLMLCLLAAVAAHAGGWNQQQYSQIEQSIRVPQFAAAEYPITKYGATATPAAGLAPDKAKALAAKNQKAIQNARRRAAAAWLFLQGRNF